MYIALLWKSDLLFAVLLTSIVLERGAYSAIGVGDFDVFWDCEWSVYGVCKEVSRLRGVSGV